MGANIPLPALGVQPPPQPNLIGNLSQLMGIKSQMAQQQLQQQMAPLQVQGAQQENQQRQQSMDDLKASTAAMNEWDGKNLEDLPSLILKHNGSANAVFSAKQQILAQKEKLSQIAKDDAQTGQNNIDTLAKRNDMLVGKLQTVTDGPGLIRAAQEAAQQGLIDPQHAQTAAQIAQLPPDQFQQTLSTFEKSLMGQKAQFDEASKVKEQALAERKQAFEESGGLPPEKREFNDYLQTPPKRGEAPHTPANFPAWKAAQEAAATLPFKLREKQAEQAITQGDPVAAGKLLADGSLTLSELKSRGTTPQFIVAATNAAQAADPKFNPQKSEADLAVAKSPANVAFFGSAKSLTDPGGTLDQLKAIGKEIPQDQFPVFNSFADIYKAQTGSGPVAKYAATLLGVADDYAKVTGGGAGTEGMQKFVMSLAPAKASLEAREGVIDAFRGAVNSQVNSRIGKNPVLQRMYGDDLPTSRAAAATTKPSAPPQGATHIAPGSDGRMHYTNAQGQDLGVATQ